MQFITVLTLAISISAAPKKKYGYGPVILPIGPGIGPGIGLVPVGKYAGKYGPLGYKNGKYCGKKQGPKYCPPVILPVAPPPAGPPPAVNPPTTYGTNAPVVDPLPPVDVSLPVTTPPDGGYTTTKPVDNSLPVTGNPNESYAPIFSGAEAFGLSGVVGIAAAALMF